MPSESVENYLKAIYRLEQGVGEGRVKNKDIAQELALALPSVTSMLKALASQSLIDYVPYQGVLLTIEGQRAALRVIRRHRLLELFLIETLQMGWSEVHEEAERLEHALSDSLTDRIDAFLGHPTMDPHGDPIPTRDGVMPEVRGALLVELPEGGHGLLLRVLTQDTPFLQYLATKGLVIGAALKVQEVAPFRGPITVRVEGREGLVSLSVEAAGLLLVGAATNPP